MTRHRLIGTGIVVIVALLVAERRVSTQLPETQMPVPDLSTLFPQVDPLSPLNTVKPVDAVVFVGAGDIANCDMIGGARATALLLDKIEGTIFTTGDHAYQSGSAKEFERCYGPTWGRHKARTRPAIGNHDMVADRAKTYFEYFGENAGPAGLGYYSYDLGAWHIISLNSAAPAKNNSAQMKWLQEDLAAHPVDCTLAYWHIARFSSGAHGSDALMDDVWKTLYQAGADVVLSSHDHDYERFAPQTDKGKPDPERGIREFVVGTGGGGVYEFKGGKAANSEVRDNTTYGVLKLTLKPGNYDWEFIPMAGKTFTDAGTGTCSPKK